MRKTVTFEKEVYEEIQKRRGEYLTEEGKEKTFTAAVNDILRLALFPCRERMRRRRLARE